MRTVAWLKTPITIGEIQVLFSDSAHDYVLEVEDDVIVVKEPA